MAEANPKVRSMVEAELKKNPKITNKELLEKAKGIDKDVAKLTARQFNATYPLQVKRGLKPRKRKAKAAGARKKPAAKRKPAKRAPAKRGRRRTAAGGRKRSAAAAPAKSGGAGNGEVRKVLLQLAKDVAAADKGGVVDVVARIDRYVDRVVKAKG